MRIGYPCINRSLPCRASKTFRLRSYTEQRLRDTVENNLSCLAHILRFNVQHDILFFRITSDLIPFASHPVCTFNWQECFAVTLREIGRFVKKHGMRISMHPDQFTLINSQDVDIFQRSQRELLYHAQVLDLMGLDLSAKVQIHIGGVYGAKERSMERFVKRFHALNAVIKRRLVIENDDKCYNAGDCLAINNETDIPILFDVFHHLVNKVDLPFTAVFKKIRKTWKKSDGLPMVDYSSQKAGGRPGQHAEHIDIRDFKKFIALIKGFDCDVMLEIKDKEKSALKAIRAVF